MDQSHPCSLPYRGIRPRLGSGVFIAPGAVVIGDVHLGEDSSIWFGCILRGDVNSIRIGARTNIQDGSVVHVTRARFATSIGNDVTVGHQVVLHGCTVGDRCLIGIGARVLDGAVVEEDCIIAAGSLVPPGLRVPAGMLALGNPAQVKRPLREDERATQLQLAANYVAYKNDYLSMDLTS